MFFLVHLVQRQSNINNIVKSLKNIEIYILAISPSLIVTTTAAHLLNFSPSSVDPVTALFFFFSISFSSYYLCPLNIHLSPLHQLPGHLQPSKTLEVVIFYTYHKLFSAKCAIRTVQMESHWAPYCTLCTPISISHLA